MESQIEYQRRIIREDYIKEHEVDTKIEENKRREKDWDRTKNALKKSNLKPRI